MGEKWEVFTNEIDLINNEPIKKWVKETLNNSPDYFFTAWASSTGKYHPQCTCKDGGLLIHIKRAVYIANRLCNGWGIQGLDKDMVLSATILHDIAKVGRGMGSFDDYENHPLNAEKYFYGVEHKENILDVTKSGLDCQTISIINDCIRNHMGLWTPENAKKPLKDYTLLELLVYTSDYLATTKDLVTPKD